MGMQIGNFLLGLLGSLSAPLVQEAAQGLLRNLYLSAPERSKAPSAGSIILGPHGYSCHDPAV